MLRRWDFCENNFMQGTDRGQHGAHSNPKEIKKRVNKLTEKAPMRQGVLLKTQLKHNIHESRKQAERKGSKLF